MDSGKIKHLTRLLCPPGRGLYTLSTGNEIAAPLLQMLYGTSNDETAKETWQATLRAIPTARVLLLGLPSDTGAGLIRGSNLGPLGIRMAYLVRYGSFPEGFLDVGDIICVPQLLHDGMLNESQITQTRQALFGDAEEPLPVSPLSIAAYVLSELLALNRHAGLVLLGGDHGNTWPAMLYCHARFGDEFGVVQIDAHTDLSPERLGIKHCFNTWAFHALDLMRPYHLVQVGVRQTIKTKQAWTSERQVIQFWAEEVIGLEQDVIERVVAHFRAVGVQVLYVTNDIDGTDPRFAPATGAACPEGLSPRFVRALIRRLGREFTIFGGDIMEIAPPLSGHRVYSKNKTCCLGASYLHVLAAVLSSSSCP